MKPAVARRLYNVLQQLRGEPVIKAYRDLLLSLNYTHEELRIVQTNRFIALLRYALEYVPYYRNTFQDFKGEIKTIRSPEQLDELMTRLPVVTKAQYYQHKSLFISDKIKHIRTTLNITSGSTGTPVSFPCDQLSWAYRHAAVFRIMHLYGVDIGDPYGYFFGLHWNRQLRIKTWLKDTVFNRVRVSAFSINENSVEVAIKLLMNLKVNHWVGYPSAIFQFCAIAKEKQFELPALKAVFTTAEPLYDYQRVLIEEVTHARCVNMYGSVEGGVGAFEGVEGALHESMENAHLYQSERNELFVTDLFLYAHPFIKYQINDSVEPLEKIEGTQLSHRQIGKIIGRSGVPLLLSNGRTLNANLPSYVIKPYASTGLIRQYRFVHYPLNKRIELLLMTTRQLPADIMEKIRMDCVEAFGSEIGIDISVVEEMPVLPNAKHRDFIIQQ